MRTRVLRALAARLPVAPSLALVDRVARRYARLAMRSGLPLFREAGGVAASVAGLLGETPPAATCRWIVESRFLFKVLNTIHAVRPLSLGEAGAAAIELVGWEHLEAALARGRGVLLLTGHFGFPGLLMSVLEARGVPAVLVPRSRPRNGEIAEGGDVWARVRTLRKIRSVLDERRACIVLPDGGWGTTVRVPFLRKTLPVGLGAFALARESGVPMVPFFGLVRPKHPPTLVVAPALASPGRDEDLTLAAAEFARHYGEQVRRYPCHLYYEP